MVNYDASLPLTIDSHRDIPLCHACYRELPWHASPQCPQCALPSSDNLPCGHCQQSPPAFDATHALFRYAFPLDAMLQRYKYQQLLSLASLFGALLADRAQCPLPDLLLPMPLHPQRLQERGYNQALEIARVTGRMLQLPIDTRSVARTRLAPPQASLPLKTRVQNMKNAFRCDVDLQGLNIALVDDVMTTGASLQALAKTVKQAGAARVECWVVARTLPR